MSWLVLTLAAFANDNPVPRHTVSYSAANWGYREGAGVRLELARSVSLTTALDPFRYRIGFVSHTGLELHPVSLSLGGAGWIVPAIGLGTYATGGFAPLHRDPITGAGVYAAPGVRWHGPRGRTATLLGVTGRYQLQGEQGLDPLALTLGFEYGFGKRKRSGPAPLRVYDSEPLPEAG
ncbi:MAG: hypothetical protein R3F61_20685 [Myxococcota bacterium]